jgi:hypothetical protein
MLSPLACPCRLLPTYSEAAGVVLVLLEGLDPGALVSPFGMLMAKIPGLPSQSSSAQGTPLRKILYLHWNSMDVNQGRSGSLECCTQGRQRFYWISVKVIKIPPRRDGTCS